MLTNVLLQIVLNIVLNIADRVEHSFVHGVPGTLPAHPSDGADRPAVEVIDDDVEVVHVVDEIVDLVESPMM